VSETDRQLIKGVLRGETEVIEVFNRRYRSRLLRFVLQKVDCYEDAEEIVQDTLVSAIYSLPSFLGKASFDNWLYSITRHEIADFYRKKKIKEILFSHFPRLGRLVSRALSPEMALEEKELRQKVFRCFLDLAEGYQEILRLRYIEELSSRQIAVRLQKSVKAVEMRLRRARHAFAKIWNSQKGWSKSFAAFDPRNLYFFKECLGAIGPSLQNLKAYSS